MKTNNCKGGPECSHPMSERELISPVDRSEKCLKCGLIMSDIVDIAKIRNREHIPLPNLWTKAREMVQQHCGDRGPTISIDREFLVSMLATIGYEIGALPLCPPHKKLEETGGLTLACGGCLACTLNKAEHTAAIREKAEALLAKHIEVCEADVFEINFGDGAMMTGMSPKDIYQIGYAAALFGLGAELTALKAELEKGNG